MGLARLQFVPQGPCVLQNNKFCESMFTPDPGALYIYIYVMCIYIYIYMHRIGDINVQ